MRREKWNYTIQSVAHALDVLEQFDNERAELGVTELSKRLKLHKNNIFRLLATLEYRGYIEQDKATENYRLGPRCLRIGQRYVDQIGLVQRAQAVLNRVSRACGETVLLAVHRNGGMVPLIAAEPLQPVRMVTRIGEVLPMHCTAVGKVHLAFTAPAERDAALSNGLSRFTDRTLTDRETLLRHLDMVASEGYAIDAGEFIADVCAVAAPVRDYTSAVVACLAIAGPAYRLSDDQLRRSLVPAALAAGRDVSASLGYCA